MYNIHDWNLIPHRDPNRASGMVKYKCPVCIDRRNDKSDKSLAVYYGDGIGKCHYCEGLFFKDSITKNTEKKEYKLPDQSWRNYTKLSDNLTKYLEEKRGLKQFVVNSLGWTEERYYQPKPAATRTNLVFNYFEGDVLVNKKYRDAAKNFTQSKGTKSIFYNINSAIGAEVVYITEGEFDVASLIQCGAKAVISVPNGANNNDDYWLNSEPYLRDVKKFLIATDNDEKGEALAEKIAHRLGRWRCERVIFDGKDANEDLLAGVLEETMCRTNSYPVAGTYTVNDVYDAILNLYDKGFPDTIYPKAPHMGEFKGIFSLMMGHLCVGTGIPSHGKSNFTEWFVLNLLAEYKDLKASFYSPEHQPIEAHQANFIQKFVGKPFYEDYVRYGEVLREKVTKIEIAKYAQWANEKIYTTLPDGNKSADWDWLLETFSQQIYKYGVNIFVVDAWNKVQFPSRMKGNVLQNTNDVLTMLTNFCQRHNVILILIAHPTKMQKDKSTGVYEIPDLYNVSGSADFRNQTHDGFCIYRYFQNDDVPDSETFTRFINLKTKFSFIQGEIGSALDFEYDAPSGRYFPKGEEPFLSVLVDMEINGAKRRDLSNDLEPIDKVTHIPKLNPSEAFPEIEGDIFNNDKDDDVPF